MIQAIVAAHPGIERHANFDHLRTNYNARVTKTVRCHDDLMLLRLRPLRPFVAGQYTVLGPGYWEPSGPSIDPCQVPAVASGPCLSLMCLISIDRRTTSVSDVKDEHVAAANRGKMIKRAYSIS